jgi:hypothetical protein
MGGMLGFGIVEVGGKIVPGTWRDARPVAGDQTKERCRMEEEKQVKVNVQFTVVKLLNYGAIAAAVIGLLWGIFAAVGYEGMPGTFRFAGFLEGLFFGVFGGAVLAGLGELVSSKK